MAGERVFARADELIARRARTHLVHPRSIPYPPAASSYTPETISCAPAGGSCMIFRATYTPQTASYIPEIISYASAGGSYTPEIFSGLPEMLGSRPEASLITKGEGRKLQVEARE